MSAQSRFNADGIMDSHEVDLELESWAEFVSAFALDDAANWIFRGQGDAKWPLSTTLQRALKMRHVEDPSYRAHVENSSIGFFKDRSRLHLPTAPDEQDLLGWLALMQHYGAPTRLQDWTVSPFVAVYFAYREDHEADDAVLWAIQAYYCRQAVAPGKMVSLAWDHLQIFDEAPTMTQAEKENEILRESIRGECGWPLPMLPFNVDARMTAQQSAFLVATDIDFAIDDLMDKSKWRKPVEPHPFSANLAQRLKITPLEEPYQLIKRIPLPRAWRDDALRSLRRMGITDDTMFPGTDGAGRATARQVIAEELSLRDTLNMSA
jgi:FRG domain